MPCVSIVSVLVIVGSFCILGYALFSHTSNLAGYELCFSLPQLTRDPHHLLNNFLVAQTGKAVTALTILLITNVT